ncbi:hypothetical protein ACMFMF_000919 [Clarireedia jacksonii]
MPRIPAGTASTSALDNIACSLAASVRSPSEGLGLLRSLHNFIVARGAKFGMPLTVPWPPEDTHGVKSAIKPSRSKNGYGRELFIVGSSLSAAVNRINFPILPPHLHELVRALLGFYHHPTYVSFTPQRFGALLITASITEEDMSWPAALAGKLYSNSGI